MHIARQVGEYSLKKTRVAVYEAGIAMEFDGSAWVKHSQIGEVGAHE